MQAVNKLTMVFVVVSDMKKAKEFYAEKLGLAVATDYRRHEQHQNKKAQRGLRQAAAQRKPAGLAYPNRSWDRAWSAFVAAHRFRHYSWDEGGFK